MTYNHLGIYVHSNRMQLFVRDCVKYIFVESLVC